MKLVRLPTERAEYIIIMDEECSSLTKVGRCK
jgi:hypothetical protein